MKPIKFWAIVGKVQTMADNGIRVYLDLPETAVMQWQSWQRARSTGLCWT